MKGLSPLVATVLLIAFTVGVGGMISVWISSFTQTSSDIVSKQGEAQLICSNGAIDLSYLKYCNNNVTGIIKNTGRVTVGNITLQVIGTNNSQVTIVLNDSAGGNSGNYLALKPGQIFSFNQSLTGVGANYDKIWVYTNCSSVNDLADRSDVTAC